MVGPAGLDQTALLSRLWSDRIRQIATTLANSQAEHREIANLAEHIGQDYHGRFLLELLQNAGDQNLKAGLTDGLAVIITAPGLIAVGNSGAPFDTDGVESVTSLGLSGKDAAIYVGNKGVGFKSVYQITDQPELYSHLQDGQAALRLLLSRAPFAHPTLAQHTEQTLATLPVEYPGVWSLLLQRYQTPEQIAAALREGVRQAAPFKFPVPLPETALSERLATLQVPEALLQRLSTLVILPVLPAQEDVVRTALRTLLEDHGLKGSMLLFTEGISELVVLDRVDERETRIHRAPPTEHTAPGVNAQLYTVTTAVDDEDPQRWLCARRVLGTAAEGVDVEAEQARIQAATSTLPGEGWSKVQTAPVTVALPIPDVEDGRPLGCRGRLTIALPTNDTTGSPWWIDARFHGNISRTGIDLTAPYNQLLFKEALRLIGVLLDHLRRADTLAWKRLVTLSMELQPGPLKDALCAEGGLAHGAIILSHDGDSFHSLHSLRLLPAAIMRYPWLLRGVLARLTKDAMTEHGLLLPDAALMLEAWPLLESLALAVDRETLCPGCAMLLERPTSGSSWLEHLAEHFYPNGRSAWHNFLEWATSTFTTQDLETHRILPTTTGCLAASTERVFLLPHAGEQTDDDASLEDIPESVKTTLRFLDEERVHVRHSGRQLTWIGVLLSPDRGTPLVHRPRLDQLTIHALRPRLQQAIHEADITLAIQLLTQAIRWLGKMSEGRHQTIQEAGGLLLPTASGDWASSTSLYFSRGWLEQRADEDALIAAYKTSPGLLQRWTALRDLLGLTDADREGVRLALAGAGVAATPRLLTLTAKRPAPLHCSWNYRFRRTEDVQSPFSDITISAQWSSYLDHIIASTEAPTKSGYSYRVGTLQWLEGLERPEAREAVVRLLLAHPTRYLNTLQTDIRRADGSIYGGRPAVETLWVHALRRAGWAVFPTENHGLCTADAVWVLSESEQRRRSYTLLRVIQANPSHHGGLLTALHIPTIHNAPLYRLSALLHELADDVQDGPTPRARDIIALLGILYSRIAEHLHQHPDSDLAPLLATPIPVLRGNDTLAPVSLPDLDEPVYIADDSVRSRFIPGWSEALRLPGLGRTQNTATALAAAFCAHTAPGRVQLTSTVVVETGFKPTHTPTENLLSWLELRADTSLLIELGLILAYGTTQQADLTAVGSRFHTTWEQLKATHIRLGTFPAEPGTDAFYDKPTLDLTAALEDDPLGIVPHLWLIMGPAYRDALSVYCHERRAGAATRFFIERQIGPEQIDAVEAAIGRSDRLLIKRFRAVLLVFWQHAGLGDDVEGFQAALQDLRGDLIKLEDALQQPNLSGLLQKHRDTPEEAAIRALLQNFPDGIARWQQARSLLGEERHRFSQNREKLTKARKALAWGLMSEASRTKGADLPGLGHTLTAWLARPLPDELLCLDPELLPSARSWAREQLGGLLTAALAGLLPATELPGTAEDRERYRTVGETARAKEARHAWEDIHRVAEAVTKAVGEELPPISEALTIFLEPPWANLWCALRVGEQLIGSTAKETAALLKEQDAFEKRLPWRELWSNLKEHIGTPPTPAPKPPKPVQLLDTTLSPAHFQEQLLSGSTGPIGTSLQNAAADDLNWACLRRKRTRLATVTQTPTPRTTHRTGQPHPGAQYAQEIGATGEAFVYEQFRKLGLPGFDASCWISSNARAYGIQGLEDDGCGYDFRYRDPTGKIAGRPGLCLIEVKSTVKSGRGSFILSINEWNVAQECHHSSDDRIYVIVRVGQLRTSPEIADILVDPVAMEERGELRIAEQALKVTVGSPVGS